MRSVPGEDAFSFWSGFFGPSGLFGSLAAARSNLSLVKLIASVRPDEIVQVLEAGLRGLSTSDRKSITDNERRGLVAALEELLFRRRSSAAALRAMAYLAEAENETYANNATGIVRECFKPLQIQLPLPLTERLRLVQDWLAPGLPVERRLLAVKSIEAACEGGLGLMLRSSGGIEPLDSRPQFTYGEIWDYLDALAALLSTAADDAEPQVGAAARLALPGALSDLCQHGRLEDGVRRLVEMTDRVHSGGLDVPLAQVAQSLSIVEEQLNRRIGNPKTKPPIWPGPNRYEQPVNAWTKARLPFV
jgi:hypothetical protein